MQILKLCLEKGLNLQTHTPALSISSIPHTTHHRITTPRGHITTPSLILATNAYTPSLLPSLQSHIVPLRGQITAQRPGTGLPSIILPTTYSFIYDRGYEYMIPRPLPSPSPSSPQWDIVIGGGLERQPGNGVMEHGTTDDSTINPEISEYLGKCAAGWFGKNWGGDEKGREERVKREWTGILATTADGLPFVGPVPRQEGVWVCAGFIYGELDGFSTGLRMALELLCNWADWYRNDAVL